MDNRTPHHYKQNKIDIIEFLKMYYPQEATYNVFEGFCIGNIHKYVGRYKNKDGLSDLYKARHYLDMLINYYQSDERGRGMNETVRDTASKSK